MWAKLDDRRALNRKLRAAGFAARGLDEAAICQVVGDQTDGHITAETVEMLAQAHNEKQWRKLVAKLVEVGRWEENGTGWYIHDYLEYNPTKASWEAEVEKKRSAGRKGGRARAEAEAQARAQAESKQVLEHVPKQTLKQPAKQTLKPTRPESKKQQQALQPPEPQRRAEHVAAAAGTKLVETALAVLAQRRLDATTSTIANPAGYLRSVAKALLSEHDSAIEALDLGCFNGDPQALADHLEPPAVVRSQTATTDSTQAAGNRLYAHNDATTNTPCPTCQGTGWTGETDVIRCENCHGTGVAA